MERVVDAVGKATYFAWTPASALAAKKDRAGTHTYYRWGPFGSPETVYNLGTIGDYLHYDGDGQLFRSRTRLGQDWYYQYDTRFNRVSVRDPIGGRSYFAYDSQDLLRTYVDPIGRPVYLTFDSQRNRTAWQDAVGNSSSYTYETTGLLRQKTDRRGSRTYMLWDSRANVTQVTDPMQNTAYFQYNSANERTMLKDPLGRVSYQEYDKRGRLVKRIDPIGAPSYWAYDARCNLVLQRDARMNATTSVFDGNSNPTLHLDALGSATYLEYDSEERLKLRRNARMNATYWTYDELGRRRAQVDPYGSRTYTQYDVAHQVTLQLNERGNPTYLFYDPTGRVNVVQNAEHRTTYLGYDLASQRVLTVDARSFPTYFQYDPRTWLRQTRSAIGAVTYTVFDQEGNRLRSVDPRGLTTYYTYDAASRLTHTTDQENGVTYTGHDRASQTVLRLDQLGGPSYMAYDLAGRIQVATDAARLVTYQQYDLVGNLIARTLDPFDAQKATTYFSYDALNRQQRAIDPYGNVAYSAYDRVGNVYFQVDELGFTTYHLHDLLDRRTNTVRPVHFAVTYTAYDPVGNVLLQVDEQGATAYMTYDRRERTYFTYDRSKALTYSFYDFNGNRTQERVQLGFGGDLRSSYFEYDPVNRPLRQRAADGGTSYFVHDLVGNRTTSIDPVGRPTYTVYDRLNRQACTGNVFNDRTYFVYDARSAVTQRRDPVGRASYLAYDVAGRLSRQSNGLGEFSYFFYDARGDRTLTVNPRGFPTYLEHDRLGRQIRRKDALGGVVYMGYDAVSNRVLQEGPEETSFQGIFRTDSTVTQIVRCNFDGSGATTVKTDASGASPLAVDLVTPGGKLYWGTGAPSIKRSNLDGTNEETVATSQAAAIFTLDPNGRQLYYSDTLANEVRALDLDTLVVRTVFSYTDLVFQLGIDSRAGKLYYANLIAGEIRRVNLDGTSDTLLLSGLTQPQSISLDLVRDHLYFTVGLNTIQRMNLDGTNVVTIKSGINAGYLWVDPVRDRLFWNEFSPNAIKSSKLDGTDTQTVAASSARMTLAIPQRVGVSSHDGLRRMTSAKDALFATTYMAYDSRSSATLRLDADGRATYMAYDTAARLTRLTFTTPVAGETADAPIYYVYDAVDNVSSVDDRVGGLGVTYFDYDRVDRVVAKKTIAGGVYYAYDLSGKRTSLKDPDMQENLYVYDNAGRLVTEQLEAGKTVYFAYDASGMLARRHMPQNVIIAYYDYDLAGRNSVNKQKGAFLDTRIYHRNKNGAIEIEDAGFSNFLYYGYDALDRLVQEKIQASGVISSNAYYAWDAASNRTIKTDEVAPTRTYYAYDARNLLTRERVLGGAGTYYDHDLAQRMTRQRSSTAATYFAFTQRDQIARLVNVAASPDPAQSCSYTGAGERVRVREGSTETYWSHDGGKLLRERTSTGALVARYRHNMSPVPAGSSVMTYFRRSDTSEWVSVSPRYNHQGSVQVLSETDGSENALATYVYPGQFGVTDLTSATNASAQRLQFGAGVPMVAAKSVTQGALFVADDLWLPGQAVTCGGLKRDSGLWLGDPRAGRTGGARGLSLAEQLLEGTRPRISALTIPWWATPVGGAVAIGGGLIGLAWHNDKENCRPLALRLHAAGPWKNPNANSAINAAAKGMYGNRGHVREGLNFSFGFEVEVTLAEGSDYTECKYLQFVRGLIGQPAYTDDRRVGDPTVLGPTKPLETYFGKDAVRAGKEFGPRDLTPGAEGFYQEEFKDDNIYNDPAAPTTVWLTDHPTVSRSGTTPGPDYAFYDFLVLVIGSWYTSVSMRFNIKFGWKSGVATPREQFFPMSWPPPARLTRGL